MNTEILDKRIVIVGGGFAGVLLALKLENKKIKGLNITLISNKSHFEYYPRIYKAVTGDSPLEICIPLEDIFKNKNVNVIKDEVISVDHTNLNCVGQSGSIYKYDDIVLALGSENSYFGLEGIKERSFSFKTIQEAIKLKRHLHKLFDKYFGADKEDSVSGLNVVVVGGGPTGVEFCGELVGYLRKIAKQHNIDNSFVTVDLIESSPRLLAALPKDVSERVYKRLHSLGVNIFLNRFVVKEDVDEIQMKDMLLKSRTLVWTAGSRPHHMYASINGLKLDSRTGKVLVGENLDAIDAPHVYVAGDGAYTKYSGMAQTAIHDGNFLADVFNNLYKNKKTPKYKPKKVAYAIPVGPKWAAISLFGLKFYGLLPYLLRLLIDLKFFISILPIGKAICAFRNDKHLCENCQSCIAEYK